jgi:hypothetical protein
MNCISSNISYNHGLYANLCILNSNKAFPWIFRNKIWSVCNTRYHNVPLITRTLCLIWTCLHKIKKKKISVDVFSYFFKYQNTVFIHMIVWNIRWNTIHFPCLIKFIMHMLYLLTTSCSDLRLVRWFLMSTLLSSINKEKFGSITYVIRSCK